MTRSLVTERTYQVSNFEPIKLVETIDDVPDELMFNFELIDKIRYLQFVNIELSYRNYLILAKKSNSLPLDEALAFLEKEKATTTEYITNIINNRKEDK